MRACTQVLHSRICRRIRRACAPFLFEVSRAGVSNAYRGPTLIRHTACPRAPPLASGHRGGSRQRGSAVSLAREVREGLLQRMRAGEFADGRLPPEADLARELGVSRTTVRAALHTLEQDGIVSRRRRHGTIVNAHMLHGSLPLNRLL